MPLLIIAIPKRKWWESAISARRRWSSGVTFMEIDGLRWDTVGDARGTGPRWHLAPTNTEGFVARHPPGLGQ